MTAGARGRPAAGGGHWVHVDPERIERWVAGFAERHEGAVPEVRADGVLALSGGDGSRAEVHPPFPARGGRPGDVETFAAAAREQRVLGVLLVRRGGHAAGVFRDGALVSSKVGTRHVQGRSAAGGWSQQRFARRRAGQAREALQAAAEVAAAVLLPAVRDLDAVVTGGDRQAVATVLDDPRLAALRPLVAERHLEVPDPRRAVLEAALGQARAVAVLVREEQAAQ